MPRKQFKADLNDAIQGKHGVEYISECQVGEDDGDFTFLYTRSTFTSPVSITAKVAEQSDYPTKHAYTIYTADDTPSHVAARLQFPSSKTTGKSINQLLSLISSILSTSYNASQAQSDSESEGLEDEDPDDADGYDDIFNDDSANSQPAAFVTAKTTTRASSSNLYQSRIRNDLKAVKAAGFKISYFGGLFDGFKCVVSVSISARKLGISDEAMQAWRIEPLDYIVLLLQYKEGYKTKEELGALDAASLHKSLEMRLGASKMYKPTQDQVTNVFSTTDAGKIEPGQVPFRETFISKSLENLLNDRLVSLIRLRESGMSWKGAEDFYRVMQGMSFTETFANHEHFVPEGPSGYPDIVDADHLVDSSVKVQSFPLVAMQFLLRHFVRCTEFCLVCHQKLDTMVEAIKPYVCDSPLCLYQYMTLGFGPSIEHEILTQVKVVDLLISFCYASAYNGRLRDFPNGLALSVPNSIVNPIQNQSGRSMYVANPTASSPVTKPKSSARLEARVNISQQEFLFDIAVSGYVSPLKKGDWVAVEVPDLGSGGLFHCRIADASLFPSVSTGPLIALATQAKNTAKWLTAYIEKYDVNFDDLDDLEKRGVVCQLVELLPSVKQMKAYLVEQRNPNLAQWVDHISPAALSVLRWIIASNRSCILEVDPQKAVHGMPGYMQFRFAMGAPDKEHRFATAVRDTKERLKLKYDTFYAWHGSGMQNWHSIIREGLNFNEITNGRAFGNGVYFSPDCATSLGYSGARGVYASTKPWPNSDLQISNAIALNEIVNAPAEFISLSPHYVVNQVDWIQTRYLFVKCADTDEANALKFDKMPENKLEQDPARVPRGASGGPISIPAPMSKAGKRKLVNLMSPGPKNLKKAKKTGYIERVVNSFVRNKDTKVIDLTADEEERPDSPQYGDGDVGDSQSIATDDEDRELFEESQSLELAVRKGPPKMIFTPGSLDHDMLPKLPMPSYANSKATKRLQQDFRALVEVQNKTPLHELGWYIDPEKVENMYQWIVELHSFWMFNEKNKDIPLAADMKKYNVQSIVLELRFPGSYPMSPPFARVIRPRFLPFQSGGGGHVTAGGALCHMLLTSDGWLPSTTIESVLLQIRMAIASTDPKPARLQIQGNYGKGDRNSYGAGEAVEAYKRACRVHGWTVPSDFDQTAAGAEE